MFDVFVNAWRTKEIRRKLLFIALMLVVYRIGCHIGLPGIDPVALQASSSSSQNLFSLITGGGTGTLFALGIGPYITSSIIMQLLTYAIPKLEQIQKEGEEGRKKINEITRYVAVALSTLQASASIYSLRSIFAYQNMFVYIIAVLALVTGSMFIMWIGELLTEKGIGNGTSFIIASNILSSLPNGIQRLYGIGMSIGAVGWILVAATIIFFGLIIGFVVLVQDGERKIPVQYSKKMVGRQMMGGQASYLPIKVNIAGVMSIIFAVSLLQTPQYILQFFPANTTLETIAKFLNISHPVGAALYIFLIFCFTFFYTSFAVNPVEMAENLKKNGGMIPGIRPGKPTSDYISNTINRLSWIGAGFYSIIAMIPVLIQWATEFVLRTVTGDPSIVFSAGFGGTTLLIVTGVALELVKQMESQLLMRHHKGFLS